MTTPAGMAHPAYPREWIGHVLDIHPYFIEAVPSHGAKQFATSADGVWVCLTPLQALEPWERATSVVASLRLHPAGSAVETAQPPVRDRARSA